MILLNVLQSISLFKYFVLHNTVISRHDKSNFLVLHNIKNAFLASVNQTENKFLNGYLSRLFNLLFSAP